MKVKVVRVFSILIICVGLYMVLGVEVVKAEDKNKEYSLKRVSLTLKYDDRYNFEKKYPDYTLVAIKNDKATSKSLDKKGKVSNNIDKNVIISDKQESNTIVARGIGTSHVYLAHKSDSDKVSKNLNDIIDGKYSGELKNVIYCLDVKVVTASISLFFVIGQSNAEGSCPSTSTYDTDASVLCEKGQVYTSYIPSSDQKCRDCIKISSMKKITEKNVDEQIPSSLISDTNIKGSTMKYKLDALSTYGNGKTGLDSGLGYEWNRLSGQKAWVINAATAASKISEWKKDGSSYKRAIKFFEGIVSICNQEVKAGHIKINKKMMVWLQGEANKEEMNASYSVSKKSADTYADDLKSVYKTFNSKLSFNYFGSIMVRASYTSTNANGNDGYMNGPRRAQFGLSFDSDMSKYYVVSNANDSWLSDSGVKSYFIKHYPSGSFSYPLRKSENKTKLPTTIKQVHPSIHYTQYGHNENGVTAAKTFYNIVFNKKSEDITASFRNCVGKKITNFTINKGDNMIFVPVVDNNEVIKQIQIKINNKAVSFSKVNTILSAKSCGDSVLSLVYKPKNKTILQSNITVATKEHPKLQSISNTKGSISFKWQKIGQIGSYTVFRKTGNSSWKKIATTNSTSYVDTNVSYGNCYSYTVRGVDNKKKNYLTNFDKKGLSIAMLSTGIISSLTKNTKGVAIKWNKVKGADEYRLYRKIANGKFVCFTKLNGNVSSYTDSGVKNSQNCVISYAIKPYIDNCAGNFVEKKITCYGQVAISSVRSLNANQLDIAWKKINSASGYEIQLAKDNTFNQPSKIEIYSKNIEKETIYNLTSNARYYVRLRYYMNKNGKKVYGEWSKSLSSIVY